MPGLEHTASQLRGTQTDYQRIANAQSLAGPPPSWSFSSRAFTDATSNRELEISTHGCGITPRVWPDSDARISEVPVTSRQALRYATTALAQQGRRPDPSAAGGRFDRGAAAGRGHGVAPARPREEHVRSQRAQAHTGGGSELGAHWPHPDGAVPSHGRRRQAPLDVRERDAPRRLALHALRPQRR
eukprot:CAMPEP_0115361200 /NCGR_PEP_ID=MMETSP0270-20121206/102082_1 /TAXON_ID=71861 /ORGANISM="Scrippsiella trochoidea, Strain CCMP3099" /LENGTH=185 /DNA_ID=CAMNT_0002783763 /DNA_START=31 /DNA_END=584 /DNA_ORIENTATION=+